MARPQRASPIGAARTGGRRESALMIRRRNELLGEQFVHCIKTAIGLTFLLLLTGCETTRSVSGMLGEGEALSGSITFYTDGGTIEMFGGARTHCVGSFQYRRAGAMPVGGDGHLICDDRRSGPFSLGLHGADRGKGAGMLTDRRYQFRF